MVDVKDPTDSPGGDAPGGGQETEADFGYRRVPASERDRLVRASSTAWHGATT